MPDLSEALIQRYCSDESFRRGQEYHRQGCVASLIQRGQELRAEVAGSQFAPYSVRVVFDEAGIIDASCSCPYDWGGLCKHIIATLLASLHEPESVRELPALEDARSGLKREELKYLLLKPWQRAILPSSKSSSALSASSESSPVNVDAIRRRLRVIRSPTMSTGTLPDTWTRHAGSSKAHGTASWRTTLAAPCLFSRR